MARDHRRLLARPDLAASALQGVVEAARFADPVRKNVTVATLDLKSTPSGTSLGTQLLYGEQFDVLEDKNGVAWGQSVTDGYVGYVAADGLGETVVSNARITALTAPIYPEPNFKSVPVAHVPWLGEVAVEGEGDYLKTQLGYISAKHIGDSATDFVAQAERLVGVPYLWGGRSSRGLDCSALVQLSLAACGRAAPRDSDMQMDECGVPLAEDENLACGDLVFWKGHVGIMLDQAQLLHANIHHMCVAVEPLAGAIERIAGSGGGDVLLRRRMG